MAGFADIWRREHEWVQAEIARALRRVGVVGYALDGSRIVGKISGTAITYGTSVQTVGTADTAGTADSATRSDHIHASGLTVVETDGTPSVANVITLKVSNGTLSDDGGGTVALTFGNFSNPMTTAGDMIREGTALSAERFAIGTTGQRLKSDGTLPVWADDTLKVNVVFDGGGTTLTTGVKLDLEMPACTLTANRLYADQSGSVVIDIWKDVYANFPPTVADTITASAKPTLAGATHSEDTSLTGWTTTVANGDVLRFNIDSVSTIQRATLCLTATRS